MKIWINFAILFNIVSLAYSESSTTSSEQSVTNRDDSSSTPKSSTEEFKTFVVPREKPKDSTEQLSSDELSSLKSAGLRSLVNQTLYDDSNYRTNPKKVECIVEYFKKNNFNDDITSVISSVHNSTVSIKFHNNDKNNQKLQALIEDGNSSCLTAGYISIIVLTILMFVIVGVVMWLSKSEARWSKFNLA
ncbi:uncharacterized protein [Chironomus tepperi]|uniref:uncharacterized protein n=1 Tax=Chironomus tepperi TaxID=113505 RepID=UPI00391F2A9C